jgi:hypothetical protein
VYKAAGETQWPWVGSALRPSSSDVLPACVNMRASSSTSSLTSIDPPSWAHSSRACCLPAFSVKQLCNSAAPTPQCRHPTSCLCASSSTFNLHRQVCPSSTPPSSWCNVGAGLGTERTSASERPPSHAVVDILFLSGFCRHSHCLAVDKTHPSNRDTRHNVAITLQPYAPFRPLTVTHILYILIVPV